jgi:hypothetical protein
VSDRHALTAERRSAALGRLRALARVWDELIRLPVLGRSVGLDAVVGLIPGVGDVAGALVASWGLVVAATLRAPPSVLSRMLLNIGVDAIIGAVPLLGDIFDVGWHAQQRNVTLLERWIDAPEHVTRQSRLALVAVGLVLVGVVTTALWLAVKLLAWVIAIA